jgi:hypothetical protein
MGQNLRGNKISLFEQMILVDFDMKSSSLLPFSSQTMTLDTFWSRFTAKILFCWFWVSCITKSVWTSKMMGAKQGAVGIFGLLQLSEPRSSRELFVFLYDFSFKSFLTIIVQSEGRNTSSYFVILRTDRSLFHLKRLLTFLVLNIFLVGLHLTSLFIFF